MAPDKKAFVLRIGKDLWDDLQKMASDDLRSVNGEIEFLLREAVRRRRGAMAPEERRD